MSLPDKIADFTVLPVLYKKSTSHALYLRQHITKLRGEKAVPLPNGRTLFVVNIPPDATERELTLFFKPCGTVERVVIDRDAWSPEAYGPLEDSEDEDVEGEGVVEEEAAADSDDSTHRRKKRKLSKRKQKSRGAPPQVTALPQLELPLRTFRHTGSSAHVIFTDSSSLSRALSLPTSSSSPPIWPPTTAAIAPFGLTHYVALHKTQRPPLPDVKAHADSFLEVFEYNKALSKQRSEYRRGEAVVDADGFTLVTRGGAYGTTLGGGVGVASKRFMKDLEDGQEEKSGNRGKKKPKKHEKDGFYKFQLHEQKRKGAFACALYVSPCIDGVSILQSLWI
jgi:ribosomal RNA-processing protein 7